MTPPDAPRHQWSPSPHLGVLLEDIERLATAIAGAVSLGSTAPHLWDLAIIATCRLDGSPMVATPPPGELIALVDDGADPIEVQRREYAGVEAALRADDLGALLRRDVLKALPAVHRRLTTGLVATPSAGMLRRSQQVVSDGLEGRIVFHPVAPAEIAPQLPSLQQLAGDQTLHPVVVAGLLQFEILRLHPFESANGRLARVAARLVLRDAGLDPAGMAVAELPMSARRVGNYDVLAAALRSGDLTVWLETWAEDVAAGLRLATAALGIAPDDVPEVPVDELPATFTLVELARQLAGVPADLPSAGGSRTTDLDLDEARRIAIRLADAGLVSFDTGSRGLRLSRGPTPLPGWCNPISSEVDR